MRWARLVLAVVLLGGCSGGRDDNEGTLPPRASSTTVDYSVPAVIDVAYVERVMEALDHVYGDAIRILARDRQITKEFLDHLAAIYGDRFFKLAQEAWAREAADGLPTLAKEPADPRTGIVRLISTEASCVIAAVTRDFAPIRIGTPTETPQRYIALVPFSEETPRNPTQWRLEYDGFTESGVEPTEPCAS